MGLDTKTEGIVPVMHANACAGTALESDQSDGSCLFDDVGLPGPLDPRGDGGSATAGNAGSADGGSVIITGGGSFNGSVTTGNGGTANGGSVIGGAGGPDTDSTPRPKPAPPAGIPPSQPPANTPSSRPPSASSSPQGPPPNTTQPRPRPPQSSQIPPAGDGIPTPDSSSISATVTHSESILTDTVTIGTPPASMASQTHHTTTSVEPPASQSGRGPSHSLVLKILLPILGTILLVALATGFLLLLRRHRRRRELAETSTVTAYALHAGSAAGINLNGSDATLDSRHSSHSKRHLLEAMTQKTPAGSAAEPAISRASSSSSGAGASDLLEAMRHAGLPVSVVAVLQPAASDRQHDQDSEMPPSYHRAGGAVDLEAGPSSMARAP